MIVSTGNRYPLSSMAVHTVEFDEKPFDDEDGKRPRTIGVFGGVVSYMRTCSA